LSSVRSDCFTYVGIRIAAWIEPQHVKVGAYRKCTTPGVEDLARPATEFCGNEANKLVKHWHAPVLIRGT
jgi:hypothetical protein